jgi:uncharacterized protein (DUF427 family)
MGIPFLNQEKAPKGGPTHMQATWNGAVLAESDETRVVEGNHYFPPNSISPEYFKESSHHTVCAWKGVASYYDVIVAGQVNPNAAWYYPDPSQAASHIRGYIAFWHGVKVQAVRED